MSGDEARDSGNGRPASAAPDGPGEQPTPGDVESGSPAGLSAYDDRVARIVTRTGLATDEAVEECMKALEQIRSSGADEALLVLLVDRGVLALNQAWAVRVAAEAGDEAGLLAGYQLLERVGSGGMGVVYKARQISLDRIVAFKILPEELTHNLGFVARFEREARMAAKLDHENVVRAIDVGAASGKRFFVMEYVEGRTVGQILEEEGRISEPRALEIVIQVARGLEAAWRSDLVHRDIKPHNILLTKDGLAKLVDLGLAKQTVSAEERDDTQTGVGMGSIPYMAPEQAVGRKTDIRSDIYSLGVTFYHMMTGVKPFSGKDTSEIIAARFEQQFAPVRQANRRVSLGTACVIETMMALKPQDRYPDPRVLLHDLLLVAGGRDPEYASASDSARSRALKAAGSMRMDAAFVYVRPRRTRLLALLICLGVAVLGAALTWRLMSSDAGTAGVDSPPPETPSTEEVEAAYVETRALIEAGELEKAIVRAGGLAFRLKGRPTAVGLEMLREEASLKLEERRRKEAEHKAYESLISAARSETESDDHAAALQLLAEARAIRDDEQVRRLVAEARRLQLIAGGEDAERRGDLAGAISSYEGALAMEESVRLRGRVAELAGRTREKAPALDPEGAPAPAPAPALKTRETERPAPGKLIRNSIGMELLLVPGGEFLMGTDAGPEDESPRRRVCVSAFYISRHEVTNAQYSHFDPGHRGRWKELSPGDDTPAVCVTWERADAFCTWLSEKEGVRYRLPKEAEWEKAARGTDGREYPWGSTRPDEGGYKCNYAPREDRRSWKEDGFELVSPVGSYPDGASPCGALDMAGNVGEWCLDWYAPDYYRSSPERDPRGPEAGEKKAVRGGSFGDSAAALRVPNRRAEPPDFSDEDLGFRAVREME